MTELAIFHCDEVPSDFLRIDCIHDQDVVHITVRQEINDEESIVALNRDSIRSLARELAEIAEMDNVWDRI